MARPRKEDIDEITAVNKDIEAQTEKLRKLREKQKRLQEADNIKLGKLVKSIFKDSLPMTQDERKSFFLNLAKGQVQSYHEKKESSVVTNSAANDLSDVPQDAGTGSPVLNSEVSGQVVE